MEGGRGRFLFLMALTNRKHGGGLEEYGNGCGKGEDGRGMKLVKARDRVLFLTYNLYL